MSPELASFRHVHTIKVNVKLVLARRLTTAAAGRPLSGDVSDSLLMVCSKLVVFTCELLMCCRCRQSLRYITSIDALLSCLVPPGVDGMSITHVNLLSISNDVSDRDVTQQASCRPWNSRSSNFIHLARGARISL